MRIELCMSRPLRTCTVGNKGLGAKMSCLASREIHRAYLDVGTMALPNAMVRAASAGMM